MSNLLLTHATLASMAPDQPWLQPDSAILIQGDRIAWSGSLADLPAEHRHTGTRSLGGRLVPPTLIDCHTHVVHAGHRAREFEARLEGATYEAIAKAGGGILSTVRATRDATLEGLVAAAIPRVDALLSEGVGALEIKSGYGLDQDTEIRMLRAARRIAELRPVTVRTSFLGAHATPPEFNGRAGAYMTEVCLPGLRAAHDQGLVDAVDGFCETIAFSTDEMARLFTEARALGLPVKLHAEQLSNLGGAQLAASHRALSADHLEYTSEDGAAAMGRSGTVAVILPGAFYVLKETRRPPVDAFRRHGVPMAVATDLNPGTSPIASLRLCAHMACTFFGLTVPEALLGMTRHAAQALGRLDEVGTLEAGKWCDLAIWDIEHLAQIVAWIGPAPLHRRIWRGR